MCPTPRPGHRGGQHGALTAHDRGDHVIGIRRVTQYEKPRSRTDRSGVVPLPYALDGRDSRRSTQNFGLPIGLAPNHAAGGGHGTVERHEAQGRLEAAIVVWRPAASQNGT